MYLHLGRDIAVAYDNIIGIFDFDTSTHSHLSRRFFTRAQQKGEVVVVTDDLPKSAVVCVEEGRQVVYITQVSSQTLLRRSLSQPLPDNFL